MARIALTGDVMLGRNVCRFVAREPPAYVWGDALPVLAEADARFINLECVIAASGAPVEKVFNFRALPRTTAVLKAAGVDLVSVANNHVLDYGEEALLEMLDRLDAAGIARAGAGRDAAEAWRPAFLDAAGTRVGVLAFTDNEPGWAAGPDAPGTAYAPIAPRGAAYDALRERVKEAAGACDALVVSAHWGPNMREAPPPRFQRFARGLIDAGAAVFWGHSAHIFQAVERRGHGVILYDTGDLVDDYRVDKDVRNDRSFVYLVDMAEDGVGPVELVPVENAPRTCQVHVARGAAGEWTLARMERLSAPFGTRLRREDGRLVVPAEAGP